MILFLLAYLGGVLTIVSPCILPVLPFVFARAISRSCAAGCPCSSAWRRRSRPSPLWPRWPEVGRRGERIRPAGGSRAAGRVRARAGVPALSDHSQDPSSRSATGCPPRGPGRRNQPIDDPALAPAGLATGLLWAPCAGPVLGLILTEPRSKAPTREPLCCSWPTRRARRPRSRWRCWSEAGCSRR